MYRTFGFLAVAGSIGLANLLLPPPSDRPDRVIPVFADAGTGARPCGGAAPAPLVKRRDARAAPAPGAGTGAGSATSDGVAGRETRLARRRAVPGRAGGGLARADGASGAVGEAVGTEAAGRGAIRTARAHAVTAGSGLVPVPAPRRAASRPPHSASRLASSAERGRSVASAAVSRRGQRAARRAPAAPLDGWTTRTRREGLLLAVNPASLTPRDPAERYRLVRRLQKQLRRVGCYWGKIDGDWGAGSRAAMRAFTKRVNARLPLDEPDYVLLTLLRNTTNRICGPSCGPSARLDAAGRCVARPAVVAGVGGASGTGVSGRTAAPVIRAMPAPVTRDSAGVARASGGRWTTARGPGMAGGPGLEPGKSPAGRPPTTWSAQRYGLGAAALEGEARPARRVSRPARSYRRAPKRRRWVRDAFAGD